MTGTGTPSPAPSQGGGQPSAPAPGPASPSPAPAPVPSPSPAPGGRPGSGAPDAGPSRQEQMGVPNEVIAVLGYDPFGPVDPSAPPSEAVQPAPPQPAPPAGPPPAAPAAAPGLPQAPSELETLKQQLGMVTHELQQMRQGATAPAPGAQPPQPSDPVPAYQYEIPDQVLQLMASEDPAHRKLALGNVMTAVSRSVHGLMQRELATVIPALARQVMLEHMGQQEVGKDFSGPTRSWTSRTSGR